MIALPRPSEVHPRRAMLHGLRPLLRRGVGLWWDLHVRPQELRSAVRVLDDGGAVGIFPEGTRDVLVGRPWRTTQTPWPRTREHTLATSALLWRHLRDEQSRALSLTGRALPGPLPAGDIEDDSDTGFVEQHRGAS